MSPQADETTDGENIRMDVKVDGQKITKRSCEPRVRWRMNGHQVAGAPNTRMSIGTGTTVGCPAIEEEEDMRKRGRLEKDEERMPMPTRASMGGGCQERGGILAKHERHFRGFRGKRAAGERRCPRSAVEQENEERRSARTHDGGQGRSTVSCVFQR